MGLAGLVIHVLHGFVRVKLSEREMRASCASRPRLSICLVVLIVNRCGDLSGNVFVFTGTDKR